MIVINIDCKHCLASYKLVLEELARVRKISQLMRQVIFTFILNMYKKLTF